MQRYERFGDQGAQWGEDCANEADEYDDLMNLFLITHIICFVACLSREIYCAKTDLTG